MATAQFRDRVRELRRVRAGDLLPDDRNWRVHPARQSAALRGVLAEVGYADALLARETPGGLKLIDGHLRAGLDPEQVVPVLVVDVDEAEAAKLLATLDPLAGWAEADAAKLDALLREVDTGCPEVLDLFTELAEANGLAPAPEPGGGGDEFDAKPEQGPTRTAPGDLWVIGGKHRLLVGDCTVGENVERLLGGEKVGLCFTSPPYAEQREYDGASGFKPIPPSEYVEWWGAVQACVKDHLAPDGSFFVNIKPSADGLDTELYVFDLVCAMVRRWGWHFATEFCWERVGVPKGVTQRFKNQFEPVYQFALARWKMRPEAVMHKSDSVPLAIGEGAGNTGWGNQRQGRGGGAGGGAPAPPPGDRGPPPPGGGGGGGGPPPPRGGGGGGGPPPPPAPGMAYPGNRLPTFGQAEAMGHTAAFPVGLPSFFIKAYTDAEDSVYDPFAGQWSTGLAAHRLGRRSFSMELSPRYADVILRRAEAEGLACEKAGA